MNQEINKELEGFKEFTKESPNIKLPNSLKRKIGIKTFSDLTEEVLRRKLAENLISKNKYGK